MPKPPTCISQVAVFVARVTMDHMMINGHYVEAFRRDGEIGWGWQCICGAEQVNVRMTPDAALRDGEIHATREHGQ